MSEELLELVKSHTNCAQTPNLPTHANANILAVQIADLITRNLQEKQKLNTFIVTMQIQIILAVCINKVYVLELYSQFEPSTQQETMC